MKEIELIGFGIYQEAALHNTSTDFLRWDLFHALVLAVASVDTLTLGLGTSGVAYRKNDNSVTYTFRTYQVW